MALLVVASFVVAVMHPARGTHMIFVCGTNNVCRQQYNKVVCDNVA